VAIKKTWNKSKNREFVCGYCTWCKKELLNTMGGWIITAKKQYFCHDGKDGSCFDLYCNIKLEQQENNEKKGYHKTKSGKTAKKGLYYNINKRKKAGTSRSKKKSTISSKAYKNMKSGFKK
jgi:hypothetical protein